MKDIILNINKLISEEVSTKVDQVMNEISKDVTIHCIIETGNTHTHNATKFIGCELETQIRTSPKKLARIINSIISYGAADNIPIESDTKYFGFLENNIPLIIVDSKDETHEEGCGKVSNMKRIIFPDENGKFPFDEDCEEVYKSQLDM